MIRHSFLSFSLVGALFAGGMGHTTTDYGEHSLMEAFFSAYNNSSTPSEDHDQTLSPDASEEQTTSQNESTPSPHEDQAPEPLPTEQVTPQDESTPSPHEDQAPEPLPTEQVTPQDESTPKASPSESDKSSPKVAATDLQVDVEKVSIAFGHLIGRNLNSPGFRFDLEGVITGMRQANEGMPSPMTQEEYEQAMATIQAAVFYEMADANLEAAKAFLLANASRPGVVELDPGHLQVRTLQAGTKGGRIVAAHSSPTLHYVGRYADGTVFGTSRNSDEPITLSLDQTIPGFSKGVIGMQEGERREIYVHPALGYATSGHLAPNALLIFDVEIIKAPPAAVFNDENID